MATVNQLALRSNIKVFSITAPLNTLVRKIEIHLKSAGKMMKGKKNYA
jgi:hypothetical protein